MLQSERDNGWLEVIVCVFCALVPMSAAMGAAIDGKQRQNREQALEYGDNPLPRNLPVAKITVGVTGGFVVCAAIYHLVIIPHTGVFV